MGCTHSTRTATRAVSLTNPEGDESRPPGAAAWREARPDLAFLAAAFGGGRLSETYRARLIDRLEERSFGGGDRIAQIGELADCMFFIVTGTVLITDADGEEAGPKLEPGMLYGDTCLRPDANTAFRPHNLVADGSVHVLRLTASSFKQTFGCSIDDAESRSARRSLLSDLELELTVTQIAPSRRTFRGASSTFPSLTSPSKAASPQSFLHAAVSPQPTVQRVRAFALLPWHLQEGWLRAMEVWRFSSGQMIVEAGAPNDTLYIVTSGEVFHELIPSEQLHDCGDRGDGNAVAAKDNEASQAIELRGAGSIFGESSLLLPPHSICQSPSSNESTPTTLATPSTSVTHSTHATACTLVAATDSELLILRLCDLHKAIGGWTLLDEIEADLCRLDMDRRPTSAACGKVRFDEISVGRIIGLGSFGRVHLALHRPTGVSYALKAMRKGRLVATKEVDHVSCNDRPFTLGVASCASSASGRAV